MKRFVRSIALATVALGATVSGAAAQSFYGAEQPAVELAGFGGTLALAGEQILVGEPANQMRPGLVYVYARGTDGAWVEVQRLRAVDAVMGDGFGAAMAIAGSSLLVSGSAGVEHFERDASGMWTASGTLAAPAGVTPAEAGFGTSLAAFGDVALVGAPGAADGSGAVYVYRRGATGWTESGTVPAEGIRSGDTFGVSLAFDGTHLLVGAPNQQDGTGAVHAFAYDGSSFAASGLMPTRGLQQNDRFGVTLALMGDRALVGAPFIAQATGAVFVYEMDEGEWRNTGRLAAFDGGPRTMFGMGMTVSGDEIWIGGPGNNAAYVFHPAMEMEGIGMVRKVGTEGGGGLGSALAGAESMVAAGAPNSRGTGRVVIFERSGDSWSEAAAMESEPEGFDPVAGGEVGCEDGAAVVWDCSEVDLVSFVPVMDLAGEEGVRGIGTNDNWGWQDPETGHYYALVGMTDRASFVDITDAENPVVVGILPMTEGARGSAWRDIKTYENHAFIVSDGSGPHGMQVFDLTRLREYQGGDPIVFDEDTVYREIASAHNIVINEETGYAFSVGSSSGGETCGGGLHIINIQDPKNPAFAGCFSDPQTGRSGTGYTHDAQCVVYRGPDEAYSGREVCFGANETALSIADVTDKDSTVALSNAPYPHVAYSHQGWLTEDHRFFYMNDELDEIAYWRAEPEERTGGASKTRTLVWDVSDLDDPQLVAEHLGTEESSDHNLYVVGDIMYQSNYRSGLRILDISDPAAPVEVAYFDTVPYGDNSAGMGGSWSNFPFFDTGLVIVTSGREGLFVVRPTIRRTVF